MRSQFPLFQSHLDLAHSYWAQIVQQGDRVIDATCGNGKDTLLLAQSALESRAGKVWALDLQVDAISSAQSFLAAILPTEHYERIRFVQCNHTTFPKEIQEKSIKLIVYNLGYLPRGDKKVTTVTATTLQSLEQAIKLLCPGGAISVTCYPGHPEGKLEEAALLHWCRNLSPRHWSVCFHSWLNRQDAPSLILLQYSG